MSTPTGTNCSWPQSPKVTKFQTADEISYADSNGASLVRIGPVDPENNVGFITAAGAAPLNTGEAPDRRHRRAGAAPLRK